MTEKLRKNLTEKREAALARFNFSKDTFEKKKTRIKADLDEASKTLAELSKKFKWWQSLP